MSDLISEPQKACGCVGKNPGFSKLTKDEIDSKFASLAPGMWRLTDDDQKIVLEFKTRNWNGAIAFINEMSVLAESVDISHHPGE